MASLTQEGEDYANLERASDEETTAFGKIAVKHSLAINDVIRFANWLGGGIGDPKSRERLLRGQITEGKISRSLVERLSQNDQLLLDLLWYAKAAHLHSRGVSSNRLRRVMDSDGETQVRIAKAYIKDVLDGIK